LGVPREALIAPGSQRLIDAGLALSPEQISKTSVADAVRKTAKWNELMAAGQGGANPDLQRGISAVHKEYPDGMKWVRTDPAGPEKLPENVDVADAKIFPTKDGKFVLTNFGGNPEYPTQKAAEEAYARKIERRAGLGAEGDVMGHCVGSNCDTTYKNSTIYSLRDAKGTPHVTVEVRAARPESQPELDVLDDLIGLNSTYENEAITRIGDEAGTLDWLRDVAKNHSNKATRVKAFKLLEQYEGSPAVVNQIKGRANAAPISKYLPYVQDFVKGGNWGTVHDLENTGLRQVPTAQKYMTDAELKALATPEKLAAWRKYAPAQTADKTDDQIWARNVGNGGWNNENANEEFLHHLLDYKPPRPEGYAHGGPVAAPTTGFGAKLAEPRAYNGKFSAAVAQRCNCGA
jgi:hypothetical protein